MSSLFYIKQCASTMDEVPNLISAGAEVPCGAYTLNQTGGRGNYGKTWSSAAGKNLAITMATDTAKKHSANLINYYTALCVREFLAEIAAFQVQIKWPNDIIISNKKIAGILLESLKIKGAEYLLAGIGINVLQEDFGDLTKAGSLLSVTGKYFNPESLAENLFLKVTTALQNIPPSKIILDEFNRFLFKRDEVAAFSVNGTIQNGIIMRAEEDGHLLINMEKDGERRFYYKEIEMLY